MSKLSAPVDPREHDLPIRDYRTGAIVAWVPERCAKGLLPVVRNGLVVGYYKDTVEGRIRPLFDGESVVRFVFSGKGEEHASVFSEYGKPEGSFLVRKTP